MRSSRYAAHRHRRRQRRHPRSRVRPVPRPVCRPVRSTSPQPIWRKLERRALSCRRPGPHTGGISPTPNHPVAQGGRGSHRPATHSVRARSRPSHHGQRPVEYDHGDDVDGGGDHRRPGQQNLPDVPQRSTGPSTEGGCGPPWATPPPVLGRGSWPEARANNAGCASPI